MAKAKKPEDTTKKSRGRVVFSIDPAEQNENQKNQQYLPVLHGKATDSIATMAGYTVKENDITHTGTIEAGEVKLDIEQFNELPGTLGVSTHKLLSIGIAKFTSLNHTSNTSRSLRETEVYIPLKEYALRCGYDVIEHETDTEEEAQAEALRAKRALDNARRKINKDLAILYSASLSWKEKVRGKQGDYIDMRLIVRKGIRNGNIYIKFEDEFSQYLVKLPLTQYPMALLAVDERNHNAYSMGLKFTEHFNMDNNQVKGTAQLLKVKTLLELTTLPKADSSTVKRVGWETRIKEPFENSLDALTACGLLQSWEYSYSKGKAMTDKEATSWRSYGEWANTLIHFTLKDAPDHTLKLQEKKDQ